MARKKKNKNKLQMICTTSSSVSSSPTTSSASGGSAANEELKCLCLSRFQRIKRCLVCCSNIELPPCPLHTKGRRKLARRNVYIIRSTREHARNPPEDPGDRDMRSIANQDFFQLPYATEPMDLLTSINEALPAEYTIGDYMLIESTKNTDVLHDGCNDENVVCKSTEDIDSLPDDDGNIEMATENEKDATDPKDECETTENVYKLQDDTEMSLMDILDGNYQLGDTERVPFVDESNIQQDDIDLGDLINSILTTCDSFLDETEIANTMSVVNSDNHSSNDSVDTEILNTTGNNKSDTSLTDEREEFENVTATRGNLLDDTKVKSTIKATNNNIENQKLEWESVEIIVNAPTEDSGDTFNLTNDTKSFDLNQPTIDDKMPTDHTEMETMEVARESADNLPVEIPETKLDESLSLAQNSNVKGLIIPSPTDKGDRSDRSDASLTDEREEFENVTATRGNLLDDTKVKSTIEATTNDIENQNLGWELVEIIVFAPTEDSGDTFNLTNDTKSFDLNQPTIDDKMPTDHIEMETMEVARESADNFPVEIPETKLDESLSLAQNSNVKGLIIPSPTDKGDIKPDESKGNDLTETTTYDTDNHSYNWELLEIKAYGPTAETGNNYNLTTDSENFGLNNTIEDGNNTAGATELMKTGKDTSETGQNCLFGFQVANIREGLNQAQNDDDVVRVVNITEIGEVVKQSNSTKIANLVKTTTGEDKTPLFDNEIGDVTISSSEDSSYLSGDGRADDLTKMSNESMNTLKADTAQTEIIFPHTEGDDSIVDKSISTAMVSNNNLPCNEGIENTSYIECKHSDQYVSEGSNAVSGSQDKKNGFSDLVGPTASKIIAINNCSKRGLNSKKKKKRLRKIMKEFDKTVIRKRIEEFDQTIERCMEKIISNDMTTEQTPGQDLDRDDVRLRTKKKHERKDIRTYKEINIEEFTDKKTVNEPEEPSANNNKEVWRLKEIHVSGTFATWSGARPKTINISDRTMSGQRTCKQTEIKSKISAQGTGKGSCSGVPVEEDHQTSSGISDTSREAENTEEALMDPMADQTKLTDNDADVQGYASTKASHSYKKRRRRKKKAKW